MKRLFSIIGLIVLAGFIWLGTGCKKTNIQEPCHGWVVGSSVSGYGTILHTTDNGDTWNRQGDTTMIPDADLMSVSAVNNQTVWAVGSSYPGNTGQSFGTILHTTNGGQIWTRQGSPTSIPDCSLLGVSAVNDHIAWSAGSSGTILKTSDGGAHWIQQAQGILPNTTFQAIYAYDHNHVWAVGVSILGTTDTAVILHTTDGGNTWVRQGETELQGVVGLIDIHAVSPNTVWTVGTDNASFLSTDGGAHWVNKHIAQGGIVHNNAVCAVTEQTTWVAVDAGAMYFTANTGDTWAYSRTPIHGIWPNNLGVTAVSEDTVWVTSGGGGTPRGQIFHTVDRGTNWVEQFASDSSYLRGISFVGAAR